MLNQSTDGTDPSVITEAEHERRLRKENTISVEIDRRTLIGPVTKDIFHTPVRLWGSGKIVEKATAEAILNRSNPVCPITKKKIFGFDIDSEIKDQITRYLEQHPEEKENQYTYDDEPEVLPTVSEEASSPLPSETVITTTPNTTATLDAEPQSLPEEAQATATETIPTSVKLPTFLMLTGKDIDTLTSENCDVFKVLSFGSSSRVRSFNEAIKPYADNADMFGETMMSHQREDGSQAKLNLINRLAIRRDLFSRDYKNNHAWLIFYDEIKSLKDSLITLERYGNWVSNKRRQFIILYEFNGDECTVGLREIPFDELLHGSKDEQHVNYISGATVAAEHAAPILQSVFDQLTNPELYKKPEPEELQVEAPIVDKKEEKRLRKEAQRRKREEEKERKKQLKMMQREQEKRSRELERLQKQSKNVAEEYQHAASKSPKKYPSYNLIHDELPTSAEDLNIPGFMEDLIVYAENKFAAEAATMKGKSFESLWYERLMQFTTKLEKLYIRHTEFRNSSAHQLPPPFNEPIPTLSDILLNRNLLQFPSRIFEQAYNERKEVAKWKPTVEIADGHTGGESPTNTASTLGQRFPSR